MNEEQAKGHLKDMLESFNPGTVLHILAQILSESEETRAGGLDEAAMERLRDAEGFLWVSGCGLMAALPR